MGLLKRLSTTLSAKANELLERFENPAEALDYAYELEVEQLRRVRRAIEHVTDSQQRLKFQSVQLEDSASELERRAREAVDEGREDVAREAVARRSVIKAGIASLSAIGDELAGEDDKFIKAAGLLESKVEILAAQKEALKANYAITKNKTEIDRTVSAIRDEVADIRSAVQRAEDNAALLRARTTAIDVLLNSGSLLDFERSPELIGAELREIRNSVDFEREFLKIKHQPMPGGAND